MFIARLVFLPEFSHLFIDSEDNLQNITEMRFSSDQELKELLEEFNEFIDTKHSCCLFRAADQHA